MPTATRRWIANAKDISKNLPFLIIVVQFALVVLLLKILDIESSAFRRVYGLAGIGFVIHHFLPPARRFYFFLLLSVSAIILVMGGGPERSWDFVDSIVRTIELFAIGIILIGICHLPIRFWIRATLLAGVGASIYFLRSGIFGFNGLAVVGPILAGMFMMRLFIYLYDLSKSANRPSITQSLCYFFLLPNVCCTLFPVIDFKEFGRSRVNNNIDPLVVYQRGISWMTRGIVHLVIYRVVNQLLFIKMESIANGTDLIGYIVASAFLYLKVSGLFHLIIGLLLLFGFNLPEANHRYFLASSFSDYWRRVNIYWKEFMMKVFFYPVFFRFKNRSTTLALIIGTLVSFFATWILHLYQTLLLKGSASVTWPDTLFWLVFALLVLANSLVEMNRKRKPRLSSFRCGAGDILILSMRTAGVFASICILWSLWSSNSVTQWIGMWKYADWNSLFWSIAILVSIMAATVVFEVLPGQREQTTSVRTMNSFFRSLLRTGPLQCTATLLLIMISALPVVSKSIDSFKLRPIADAVIVGDSLAFDETAGTPGYYERLSNVCEGDRLLWEVYFRRHILLGYQGHEPVRRVQDFRIVEMLANIEMNAYGTQIKTNRWGMRDHQHNLVKAPGTIRVALLGSSHVMGWGVSENQRFDTLLEARINHELFNQAPPRSIEILNFAVSAYGPMEQISVVQHKVRQFNPDIVVLVSHLIDFSRMSICVHRCLQENVSIPKYLKAILSQAGVGRSTHRALARERLKPFEPEMLEWSYGEIVNECKSMGAVPCCVFMPLAYEMPLKGDEPVGKLLALARKVGFITIDMSHMYDGQRSQDLLLNEPYKHSNEKNHALIAEILSSQLIADPNLKLNSRSIYRSSDGGNRQRSNRRNIEGNTND
jgi:hypothetical protein